MNMYNMVNGATPATFVILPMLGKHPDEYPRFRDCFLADPDRMDLHGLIHVYTRVGGNNREHYEEEIAKMRAHENFVTDFDDDFDNTYATYVFDVPEKWKADFDLLIMITKEDDGTVNVVPTFENLAKISEEYKAEMCRVFPKLKDKFDALFKGEADAEEDQEGK